MANDNSALIEGEIPESQFAEQLLQQIHTCEPLITADDCARLEQLASSAEFGMGRRVGLAVAAMSGQRFVEMSTSMDRKQALAMAEGLSCLGDYINRTQEMMSSLHAAWWRLFTALAARDDADSIGVEMDHAPKTPGHGGTAHA